MALDVDTLLDRRRQTRRIVFWRAAAILIAVAAIVIWAREEFDPRGAHVARLPIEGAIVSDRPLLKLIAKLGEEDDVAGVVVSINSPGGTSVGGERLYDALRELSQQKPVVSHINTVGASAAYMTALGTDHIVAHRSSLTGSIGVLIQYGEAVELLESIGVSVSKVDSGPLKADPSPFERTDPAAIAMLQSVVDDTFDYFLDLVVERRDMSEAEARGVSTGRIFTGGQALDEGLIDAIGGEDAAIAWLETERGVRANLPVRTYRTKDDEGRLSITARLAAYLVAEVREALGLPTFALGTAGLSQHGSVDGLWSVWQGSGASDTRIFNND